MDDAQRRSSPDQYMMRFPAGMREQVKEIAARNRRTMNSEIVLMIERALRGEQAAGNGPEKANPAAIDNSALQGAAIHPRS